MFIWQRKIKYRLNLFNKKKRKRLKFNPQNNRNNFNFKKFKVYTVLIIAFIIIFWTFSSIEHRVNPIITNLALSTLNGKVLDESNNSVSKVISKHDVSYDSLVDKITDDNNDVKSLSLDYKELNMLKSELAVEVQERIHNIKSVEVSIPLLTLFSDKFYSGMGVPINIKVVSDENVKIEFCDEFVSAGINQTKHLVKVKIIVNIAVRAPVVGIGDEVITEIPIAESIIIGNIPNTYLNFK